MSKIWRTSTASSVVLQILKKKKAVNDTDLYEMLKEMFGDFGFREFNKLLMSMEIRGLILVSSLVRGKRRVELVDSKR
ncbi:MAG TPA: hypothetical protein ENF76_01840 [Candidatus Bathyarchaeota archaeon]|nr:MAG: hypothetical protein DRO50_03630 [Candidatus Bathyarchaeota archaeon]HDI07087.1 hypothetical protein [Candidatus Bathyarchaeota archaeon]